MYSIGIDLGSSSVKVALWDCERGRAVAHATYPTHEMKIEAPQSGFAEQNPEDWWQNVKMGISQCLSQSQIDKNDVKSIGIAYQMHGLVLLDAAFEVIRPSIIWCDGRAVSIGNEAFKALNDQFGEGFCLTHYLNSPGNFTASKLRWVQLHEPKNYAKVRYAMLPGDYIAFRLTGEVTTTVTGLSEGIFWDFQQKRLAQDLLALYQIDSQLLPPIVPSFGGSLCLQSIVANELGLSPGIAVSYRAGDQPNNALSLNVLRAGEVAATAGTSGVVYGVIDEPISDAKSRVNVFAHVNYQLEDEKLGVLLCINGTGSLNAWLKRTVANTLSYEQMNDLAQSVAIGADGLSVLPFGNGAERMLSNRLLGAQILGIDFNRQGQGHLIRAAHEGVAFAFAQGIDIMKDMGLSLNVIRAGYGNLFLSPVFRQTLANITGSTIELHHSDGAQGAARGAAFGAGLYTDFFQAFENIDKKMEVEPNAHEVESTRDAYHLWCTRLSDQIALDS